MRLNFLASFLLFAVTACAQNPVSWKFTAKKTADRTFEIHLTASVAEPWHIYSQKTPEGGPVPTKILFTKNPLLTMSGDAKENGKLQTKHEDVFGVDVKYFDGSVDFVQVVKVKSKVKTNVTGSVEFMVCNDQQCLPPKNIPFNVVLE